MKITNKQLVDRIMQVASADQMLAVLTVVKTLFVRHQINAIKHIESTDPEIASIKDMIHLLEQQGKLNRIDISSMIRLIERTGGESTKQFTVVSNKENISERLTTMIDTGSEVDTMTMNDVGIVLQGDKCIYKRTLKTDIEKLLR